MALPPAQPDSTALVTGASSGIGAQIARGLARRGHGVTLVARREDRLKGLADGFGPFAEQERDRELGMIRLNVEALVDLESRYLGGMVERGRGAVINIASTASFQPLPENAT